MVSTLNYTLSHSTPIFDGSIPFFVKPAIHQSVNQSIDPQPPRTSAQTSTEAFKLVAIWQKKQAFKLEPWEMESMEKLGSSWTMYIIIIEVLINTLGFWDYGIIQICKLWLFGSRSSLGLEYRYNQCNMWFNCIISHYKWSYGCRAQFYVFYDPSSGMSGFLDVFGWFLVVAAHFPQEKTYLIFWPHPIDLQTSPM